MTTPTAATPYRATPSEPSGSQLHLLLCRLGTQIYRDAERGEADAREAVATVQGPARTELLVLVAEACQRRGDLPAAQEAVTIAGHYAAQLPRSDYRRVITFGLHADLAVTGRHADAVSACENYVEQVRRLILPDPAREATARGLLAVALYQHENCVEGRTRLRHIAEAQWPTAASHMAYQGLRMMGDGCRGRAVHPFEVLSPMPGGVLCPAVNSASMGYLAERVTRHPGLHAASGDADCTTSIGCAVASAM